MSTIADVAKLAGVSKMTVSRVVNDSGYTSQETRERVLKAIDELEYVPNALARSLRFKQTRTIALILTDITNPYFTTIARGVEDAASEQGFSVIFCNTDENPDEDAECVNVVLQKQVDGLLLVPSGSSMEQIEPLRRANTPFVVLYRRIPGAKVDTVRCDSEQGAFELTKHLIGLGHRNLALLTGPKEVTTATDRMAGFRRAQVEFGLDPDESQVIYGNFTTEAGYQMAHRALAAYPRPTGLVAANNFIAIGAMRAARETGIRIPEDASLVTFDDLPDSIVAEKFLTVVEQPAYQMGHRATTMLLARLSGKGPATAQEVVFTTQLMIRGSSAPAPAAK